MKASEQGKSLTLVGKVTNLLFIYSRFELLVAKL